ncbi:MAG: TlpA family protein disulfide reductase [Planctomycetes bacterium]|nr:TlpA family protein disulfide reductase [Planctomycetota bacterium]
MQRSAAMSLPVSRNRGAKVDLAVPIAFVVAAAISAASYYLQTQPLRGEGQGTAHVAVGTFPPIGFALRQWKGSEQINLLDLHGKVIWLNFWGAWCNPARQQMIELDKIFADLKDHPRFALVTVLCEIPTSSPGLDPSRDLLAEEFVTAANLTLPVYVDESGDARRAFQIQPEQYPTNVLLDAEGRVRGIWTAYEAGLHDQILPELRRWLAAASGQTSASAR